MFDVRCPLHGCWAVPFSLEFLQVKRTPTEGHWECSCSARRKRAARRGPHNEPTH